MDKDRSIDRLARYIIYGIGTVLTLVLCWYLRSVLLYIVLASVVSLLCRPVMTALSRVKIGRFRMTPVHAAVLSLIAVILLFLLIVTQIVPVVTNIIRTISDNITMSDYSLPVDAFKVFMADINFWLIEHFPDFGPDFRIEAAVGKFIKKMFDAGSFSAVVEHVASFFVSFGVGIFSVVFISFFFIKDPSLFGRIVSSFVPDRLENDVISAISDIEHLLSRYFVGLVIEVLGVALLNFLGLWLVARIGISAAVGIAFITGMMNIIPYVGPLVGGIIGTILSIVLKFTAAGFGTVNFWGFVILLVAVFAVTQLVDNFLFQPLIYSTSIKASPLEIFIVLLIAGHIAGMLGMLVAIPAYTVVRVIAGHFFSRYKPIRRLTGTGQAT